MNPAKTLLEDCEPFLLDVAAVLKTPMSSVGDDGMREVRIHLLSSLAAVREKSTRGQTAERSADFQRIERDLVFFADDVLNRSSLTYAPKWRETNLLASDKRFGIPNGRELFFNDLQSALGEGAPRAEDRLRVFQACLALGFVGTKQQKADELKQLASDIREELDSNVESQLPDSPISTLSSHAPDNRRPFVPNRERIQALRIFFIMLVVASVCAYVAIAFEARTRMLETWKPIAEAGQNGR